MPPRRLKVTDVNPHVTCTICEGYLVDATSIIECLHAFCRTCIVRYLETSKFCPVCDVQVHKTKPLLSIRSDQTLQDLVYKMVPGLYQTEMQRRREFYSEHLGAMVGLEPEDLGEGSPRFFSLKESISLSLHHKPKDLKLAESSHGKDPTTRHLSCPAAFTVAHLKKFIHLKFSLPSTYEIDIYYDKKPLQDNFTLLDVAYIYSWNRGEPMKFFYSISKCAAKVVETVPAIHHPSDMCMQIDVTKSKTVISKEIPEALETEQMQIDVEPNVGKISPSAPHLSFVPEVIKNLPVIHSEKLVVAKTSVVLLDDTQDVCTLNHEYTLDNLQNLNSSQINIASKLQKIPPNDSVQSVSTVGCLQKAIMIDSLQNLCPALNIVQNVPVVDNVQNVPVVNNVQNIPVVNNVQNIPVVTNVQNISVVNNVEDVPSTNNLQNIPEVNNLQNTPTANNLQNVPTANNLQRMQEVTSVLNLPAVSCVENTSAVSRVENMPVVSSVAIMPVVSSVQNMLTVNSVQNVPAVSNVQNLLTVNSVQNVPAVSNVPNLLTVNSVQNVPAVSSVQNLPAVNCMQNVAGVVSVQNVNTFNSLQKVSAINDLQNMSVVNSVQNVARFGNVPASNNVQSIPKSDKNQPMDTSESEIVKSNSSLTSNIVALPEPTYNSVKLVSTPERDTMLSPTNGFRLKFIHDPELSPKSRTKKSGRKSSRHKSAPIRLARLAPYPPPPPPVPPVTCLTTRPLQRLPQLTVGKLLPSVITTLAPTFVTALVSTTSSAANVSTASSFLSQPSTVGSMSSHSNGIIPAENNVPMSSTNPNTGNFIAISPSVDTISSLSSAKQNSQSQLSSAVQNSQCQLSSSTQNSESQLLSATQNSESQLSSATLNSEGQLSSAMRNCPSPLLSAVSSISSAVQNCRFSSQTKELLPTEKDSVTPLSIPPVTISLSSVLSDTSIANNSSANELSNSTFTNSSAKNVCPISETAELLNSKFINAREKIKASDLLRSDNQSPKINVSSMQETASLTASNMNSAPVTAISTVSSHVNFCNKIVKKEQNQLANVKEKEKPGSNKKQPNFQGLDQKSESFKISVKNSISAEFSDNDDLGCPPDLVVDEQKMDSSDNEDDADTALRKKINAIAEKEDEADVTDDTEADSGRASDMSCPARCEEDVGSPATVETTTSCSVPISTTSTVAGSDSHRHSKSNNIDNVIKQLYLQHEIGRPTTSPKPELSPKVVGPKDDIGVLDLSTCMRKSGEAPNTRPKPVANPVLDIKHRQQTYMPAPMKQHTACPPAPKHPTSPLLMHQLTARHNTPSILQAQLTSNSKSSVHQSLSYISSSVPYVSRTVTSSINPTSLPIRPGQPGYNYKFHQFTGMIPYPIVDMSGYTTRSSEIPVLGRLSSTSSHPREISASSTKMSPTFSKHSSTSRRLSDMFISSAPPRKLTTLPSSATPAHPRTSPSILTRMSPHHRSASPAPTPPNVSGSSSFPISSITPVTATSSSASQSKPSVPIYRKSESSSSHKGFKIKRNANLAVFNPDPNGFRQKLVIKNLDSISNNHR